MKKGGFASLTPAFLQERTALLAKRAFATLLIFWLDSPAVAIL